LNENYIILEVERARQIGRPRKTRKQLVDKDINDLHLKQSSVMLRT